MFFLSFGTGLSRHHEMDEISVASRNNPSVSFWHTGDRLLSHANCILKTVVTLSADTTWATEDLYKLRAQQQLLCRISSNAALTIVNSVFCLASATYRYIVANLRDAITLVNFLSFSNRDCRGAEGLFSWKCCSCLADEVILCLIEFAQLESMVPTTDLIKYH